jgi:hypothetical protein
LRESLFYLILGEKGLDLLAIFENAPISFLFLDFDEKDHFGELVVMVLKVAVGVDISHGFLKQSFSGDTF